MNVAALFLWIALVIEYALPVFSFTSDINFETDISSLSCIKMDKPDAEKFDWSSIQSNEECRRCLFATAKILGSPEAMAEWFTAQGFTDVNWVSLSGDDFVLNARWDVEKTGVRIPYAINYDIFQRWLTTGKNFTAQIRYEGSTPVDANAGHEIL